MITQTKNHNINVTINQTNTDNLSNLDTQITHLNKELNQLKKKNRRIIFFSLLLCTILSIVLTVYLTGPLLVQNDKEFLDKGRIIAEPLRANIIDTTIPWHLASDQTIKVNIINSESVSSHKINIIRDAILSKQIVNINSDSQGESPDIVYYAGWEAALVHASEKSTKFFIPTKFSVTESSDDIGNITIILSHLKNEEGYLGFTKLKIDNDQIVKATMTIYDIDNLSDADLSTITKHEFGHALGLGHSASGNDLMHDTIDTKFSYISKCDMKAVSELYDGKESTEIVCGT